MTTPSSSVPPDQSFLIRCPKLGHPIYFSYCRQENFGIPCSRTLDCWHLFFPVVDFLRQELSEEDWNQAFATPTKGRMETILETISRIEKNQTSEF